MLNNPDIRITAKEHGVFLWQIADYLQISEPTLTRKLRRELSEDEKQRFFAIIDEIAATKK